MLKNLFKGISKSSELFGSNFRSFSYLQKYAEKRGQKEYNEFLDFMTSKEKFTMVEYKQFISDSVVKMNKGIMSKIMGSDEQSKAELIDARTMLNACLLIELLNPETLRNESIQDEIEQVSKIPKERINKMIRAFEGFKSLHRYIQLLKAQNKPIPATFEDLNIKFKKDYTPSFEEKQIMAGKREEAMEIRRKSEKKQYIDSKIMQKKIRNRPYIC